MSVVLDSSVTLAWLFSDELTEPVRQVFERVTASRAWVPSLWRLEVANSLHMAARRKRIDAGLRDASLADLALLNIGTDPDTDAFAWSTTLQLAEAHALTVYVPLTWNSHSEWRCRWRRSMRNCATPRGRWALHC